MRVICELPHPTVQTIQLFVSRQDSNAPRANKRFLTSIIRSTDDHNKAVLKAQAVAAEEIKRGRREQEKRERRERAEEAVRARLSGGRHKHTRSSGSHRHMSSRHSLRGDREGWDRWDGRTANREREGRVRNVNWETWDGGEEKPGESKEGKGKKREEAKGKEQHESRRRDGRGKDRRRRRRRRKANDTNDNAGRATRNRSRTASPRRNTEDRLQWKRSASRHRSPSPRRSSGKDREHALDDLYTSEDSDDNIRRCLDVFNSLDDDLVPSSSNTPPPPIDFSSCGHKSDLHHNHTGLSAGPRHFPSALKSKSESCSRSSSHTRSMSFSSSSSSLSPGPSPPPNLPSKMDKYFKDSYDPRLDIAPLSTVPNIPATGLISDVEFEGWDAMLELIKLRRQDKEERKRLERLGLLDKKDKKGKGKDKAKDIFGSANLLDIEYKKRGSVREWDLGKKDLSF